MTQRQGISRRGFLKSAGVSAAGVMGIPYIVPASVLGANGKLPPSERVTLGFIGMGKIGKESHLPSFLQRADTQVLAVCDVEQGRLDESKQIVEQKYAKQVGKDGYKACAVYRDFRRLLARPDIDAVVISTPDHWHAIPSIEAVKAGKDVYCEKPMTHEIAEGRAMVEAVRRYGRVYQTGSQQRSDFQGFFRRATELVRAGAVGELKAIHIGIGGPPEDDFTLPVEPVPRTLDWDKWVGPAPWRPYSSTLCPLNFRGFPQWRHYRDFGGGGYNDMGAHHFDIAQWALGMDESGPVEIHPPDGKEIKYLTYRYSNGVPMYHGGDDRGSVVFHGTKGSIFASRAFLRADPTRILDFRLGPNDDHLDRQCSHRDDWLHCHPYPTTPDCGRRDRSPHSDGLPSGPHHLPIESAAHLGPGERAV